LGKKPVSEGDKSHDQKQSHQPLETQSCAAYSTEQSLHWSLKTIRSLRSKESDVMKEKIGEVFSITKDNQPVPGCTISKAVHSGTNNIIYFSLAKNTDISV